MEHFGAVFKLDLTEERGGTYKRRRQLPHTGYAYSSDKHIDNGHNHKITLIINALQNIVTFYPRDAMLARSLRQRRVCLSVCPSVRTSVCHTPVLCLAEREQDRERYTV